MKKVGSLFKGILKPIFKDYSPILLIIIRNWNSILGEKYYEYCEPERVSFQKNKKNEALLYIKTFNPVISFYLENNRYFIIEKINIIFGYNLIKDIKLKQVPKIIKKLETKTNIISENNKNKVNYIIDNIEENELKESLKILGECLYSD